MSSLYPTWKSDIMNGVAGSALNSTEGADGVYVVLVDSAQYTYNATDTDMSAVPALARSPEGELLNKTVSIAGTFDADDLTIANVTPPGDGTYEDMILFRKVGGVEGAIIAHIDAADVTNLPLTANSGSVTITFHANGIFTL